MAEYSHHDPLAGIPVTQVPPPGHYGVVGETGVRLIRTLPAALVSLAARKEQAGELLAAIGRDFGIALSDTPGAVSAGGLTFIGNAPGRWLVLAEQAGDLGGRLEGALGRLAVITEQSDSAILFELSGAKARETMAKGAMLDLDPTVFSTGSAATTVFAHIGVTFWQSTDAPDYRLLVARSYEAAFTRAVVANAAPYGLEIGRPAPEDG